MFRSFEDVLAFLDGLGMFHMDFGLDRMRRAIRDLRITPGLDGWQPYIVQIVGTNGKGSTSTFLASLGHAHGLKTGLYTSPHFVTPRERVRIDGQILSEKIWTELAGKVHAAAPDLTYFEFVTVLGLLAFKNAGVELVAMEAGLGGMHDATTAMAADMTCFVPIDLDHTKILGPTLTHIASDKAGAIRPGKPVLTGSQPEEAMRVLRLKAQECHSPLIEVDERVLPSGVELGIAGPHQRRNASLALTAWLTAARERGWASRDEAVRAGLHKAHIAGRFQTVPPSNGEPPYLLDGAHNPHGLRACRDALRACGIHPRAVIFSCLADKDVDTMLPLVSEMACGIPLFAPTIQDNERAMGGEELAERLIRLKAEKGVGPSLVRALPRLSVAFDEVAALPATVPSEAPVLVCGSLYLLGEFFTLRPQCLW